ncbi:MAG: hypothetical protein Q7S16_03575 [bacterium]|nr:hypothetical protein [bacterium]
MPRVSEEDKQTIVMMEAAGVLQDVDGHRLETPNGAIFVGCGDADQSVDLISRTLQAIFVEGDPVRPQLLFLNGGALLIPPKSPVRIAYPEDGVAMCRNIRKARALKGISTVLLKAHVPCGMAAEAGLGVEDVVRLLQDAKLHVRAENPGVIIACLLHVDNGSKRLRFLHGASWREWSALSPKERERRYGASTLTPAGTGTF